MNSTNINFYIILFIVMFIVGIFFNGMNVMVYNIDHIYLSLTLIYSGLFMASNMLWAHEIVHFLSYGHFNITVFIIGILLSVMITIFLLRKQKFINDKQWLKRMITHHSTALTTSHNIYNKTNNEKIKKIAKNIIQNQEDEIKIMKSML